MQRTKSTSTGTYRHELLRAFHMGADDLDANRRGRLGDGQVKRLQRSGAALAVGIVMFRRGRHAAARNDVECVTGPTFAQMRGRAGWYLVVGERSFRLPIRFWHVKNGAQYRVYYTPTGNLVVAMEPDGWA